MKLVVTDSGKDSSPVQGQVINWTNSDVSSIGPLATNSEFWPKCNDFHTIKCIWKCRLQNVSHFVQSQFVALPYLVLNDSWFASGYYFSINFLGLIHVFIYIQLKFFQSFVHLNNLYYSTSLTYYFGLIYSMVLTFSNLLEFYLELPPLHDIIAIINNLYAELMCRFVLYYSGIRNTLILQWGWIILFPCQMFFWWFNTLKPRQNGHRFTNAFSNTFSWMKIYKFWLRFHNDNIID